MTVDVTTTTPPSLSAWTAVCRVDDLSPWMRLFRNARTHVG